VVDPRADVEAHRERSSVADRVWDALDRLAAQHREVLVLCDLEERADSEVAALLGLPKGTVKSRLRRARAHLRALLNDLGRELPTRELRAGATTGGV
jgi:RNA polymerase sigma-70 factor (ECF subfamily)